MYFYFTGEYKAAIKINGTFYGLLNSALKTLRIDNGCPFIEICPLEKGGQTINLILDDEFLSSPPDGVSVTDLKGGYLLKFYKTYCENEFKIISQQKYHDSIITLFKENGLKLSIETQNDFYAETFSFNCQSAEIARFEIDGTCFISIYLENNYLYIYCINQKIIKVFARQVSDFSIETNLKTVELFKDIAKHKVVTEWTYDNYVLIAKNIATSCAENFSIKNLHPKLVAYAFLEAFMLNAEWKDYLCQSILDNADKLKGFFGPYIGVIPPPTFRNENQVCLLYKEKENLYSVKYYTFEISENKILNINQIEN